MLNKLEQFYESFDEPIKECFYALREIILAQDPLIDERFKFSLPFFYYNGKMCCYFWINKKTNTPYIGWSKGKFLNHPDLKQENRKLIKILEVDIFKDIDVDTISLLIKQSKELIDVQKKT